MRLKPFVTVLLPLLAVSPALFAQNYTITTFAGGGLPNNVGGTSISLISPPQAVATDGSGNLFFAYQNSVLRQDSQSGIVTIVAGNGTPGFSGDTGPAANAQLNSPDALAIDTNGNIFIADCLNSRIRKVSGGIITTVAGSGVFGFNGDNGPATAASLGCPTGVAVDRNGNLYIADRSNYIRKVSNGIITTIVGNGVQGYSGDNGAASLAQVNFPAGLTVDMNGTLYIADAGNNAIRAVSNGLILTVAGYGAAGFSGDGGGAVGAQLNFPMAVTATATGDLFIADTRNNRVRKVSSGQISTIAGNGAAGFLDNGPATLAELNAPNGVALDASGNVLISDQANSRIRIVAGGLISTVTGGGSGFGDGGPATSGWLYKPTAVAVDASGDLYIADSSNRVREVAGGAIKTVAGTGVAGLFGDFGQAVSAQLSSPLGVAADANGNVYIAESGPVREVSGTTIQSLASGGQAVAVDANGVLYVAQNNVVQKIAGNVATTVAGSGTAGFAGDNGPATSARLNNPLAIAFDSSNNLYIADSGNNRIRMVSGGVITTIAGNGLPGSTGNNSAAVNARLNQPTGVTVDKLGNVYIVDNGALVRRISGGIITTIAGGGATFQDNVPGTASSLSNAYGLTVDANGNVYVADRDSNRVRILQPQTANMSFTVSHTGDFYQGQAGATYTLNVSNAPGAGATVGLVSVTETLPAGFTLVSMSGPGWNCSVVTCTRSDALIAGNSYPITVTVNVAPNARTPLVNSATMTGGGVIISMDDPTNVVQCSIGLSSGSANLTAIGTATAGACPDASQPNCGYIPETPIVFTVSPNIACGAWTAVSSDPSFVQVVAGTAGVGAGPVGFDVLANTHTLQRSASITVSTGFASVAFAITQDGSGNNVTYRQIYALYQQLLGRDPDVGGFTFWTGGGAAGLGQMADSFLSSAEAFNTDFAVMAAYQAATGAPPNYSQYLGSLTAIRTGAQTVSGLFTALSGGSATASSLYQNLLGRAPTAGEITGASTAGLPATFQGLIGSSPGAPNNEFQSTGPFQTDHSNALYMRMLYYVILGRDPDAAGLAYWIGVANAGAPGLLFKGGSGQAVRIGILGTGAAGEGFIGSPEFQGLFAN